MKNFSILFFLLIFLSCSQNSEWISLLMEKMLMASEVIKWKISLGIHGYKRWKS